jgi:hypothetical protein
VLRHGKSARNIVRRVARVCVASQHCDTTVCPQHCETPPPSPPPSLPSCLPASFSAFLPPSLSTLSLSTTAPSARAHREWVLERGQDTDAFLASNTTLEAPQGQMDGFFIQLPYKCNLAEVAYVGDLLQICHRLQGGCWDDPTITPQHYPSCTASSNLRCTRVASKYRGTSLITTPPPPPRTTVGP